MVVPVSFHSWRMSRCIPLRVPGSSALKASSISRIVGLRDQRLRDGHALLHAAGKLVGIFRGVGFVEADPAQMAQRLARGTRGGAGNSAASSAPAGRIRSTSGPNVMLSSTVLSGNSEYFCGT